MKKKHYLITVIILSLLFLNSLCIFAQDNINKLTKIDRILACQIPQEELIIMSTEDLLERCLNYPYLVDVYFVENISLYFPHIIKSFNGFIEFFNYRDDAGSVLLNNYKIIHPNIMETKATNVEKGFTNFINNKYKIF